MKALFWVFVAFALYGVFTYHYGGALISAGVAVFVFVARRYMDRQDQEWLRDPRNAKTPTSTEQSLADQDCEGS